MRSGNLAVLDFVAKASVVFLPVITLGELEGGFALGKKSTENRKALEAFLTEPFVATLGITRPVTRLYGEIFAQLRRGGTPIPTNDIWIAALTLDCGGHLLTFDSDFKAIPQLSCTLLVP